MKRLIKESNLETQLERKIKALIKLYNKLPNIKTAGVGPENKVDCYHYIIAFLIRAGIEFAEDNDFFDMIDNLKYFQEQGGTDLKDPWNFVFKEKQFNIDIIKRKIPDAVQTATGYRGIAFDKNKIDKDNIEQSIRNVLRRNVAESWSIDKDYIDDLENRLLKNNFNPDTQVMVRMKASVEGIYLPTVWETLAEKFNNKTEEDNKEEKMDEYIDITDMDNVYKILNYDEYGDINQDYKHEEELLCPPPSTYEIYNLDEIEINL